MNSDASLSMNERQSIWAFAGLHFPHRAGILCRDIEMMLAAMQEQFGTRDPESVISRIECISCHPRIQFSGYSKKHVIISLSNESLRRAKHGDFNALYWELAHELVHLLSPTKRRDITVLEEGIACCFQHEFMINHYGYHWSPSLESYRRAQEMVAELLTEEPFLIRTLRDEQPVLACITAKMIRRHVPSCSTEMADALVRRFDR